MRTIALWVAILLFVAGYAQGAANDVIQYACEGAAGATITIDSGDGWSAPSSGSRLMCFAGTGNGSAGNYDIAFDADCGSMVEEYQPNSSNGFHTQGALYSKDSADTSETSFTFTANQDPGGEFSACVAELPATGTKEDSAEDTAEVIDSNATSVTSGSVTTSTTGAIHFGCMTAYSFNKWDTIAYSDSYVEQVSNSPASAAYPAIYCASKILGGASTYSFTFSTTDEGDSAYAASVAYAPAASDPEVAFDAATYNPGDTVTITASPAFDSAMSTMDCGTSISAESGASTSSADFILPGLSGYVSGGAGEGIDLGNELTCTVSDGTDTADDTLTINPAQTDGPDTYLRTSTCTVGSDCPDPPPDGDGLWPAGTSEDDSVIVEASGDGSIDTVSTDGVITLTEPPVDVLIRAFQSGAWTANDSRSLDDEAELDTTAPVINDVTLFFLSDEDGDLRVDVDATDAVGGGTMYWSVSAESSRTCAQIQNGTGAIASGNTTSPVSGLNSFEGIDPGASEGEFYAHACWTDAADNESTPGVSEPTTISAQSGDAPTIERTVEKWIIPDGVSWTLSLNNYFDNATTYSLSETPADLSRSGAQLSGVAETEEYVYTEITASNSAGTVNQFTCIATSPPSADYTGVLFGVMADGGITEGSLNERMIKWLQQELPSEGTSLPGLIAEAREQNDAEWCWLRDF